MHVKFLQFQNYTRVFDHAEQLPSHRSTTRWLHFVLIPHIQEMPENGIPHIYRQLAQLLAEIFNDAKTELGLVLPLALYVRVNQNYRYAGRQRLIG